MAILAAAFTFEFDFTFEQISLNSNPVKKCLSRDSNICADRPSSKNCTSALKGENDTMLRICNQKMRIIVIFLLKNFQESFLNVQSFSENK